MFVLLFLLPWGFFYPVSLFLLRMVLFFIICLGFGLSVCFLFLWVAVVGICFCFCYLSSVIFICVFFFLFSLATLHSLWSLHSLARDGASWAFYGSTESRMLDHQRIPRPRE